MKIGKWSAAQLERMTEEMRRAYELSQAGNNAEAVKVYQGVLEQARREGLDSGYLLWNLAVVADNAGEAEMASEYVARAMALDPLSQPFQNSFEVIVKRIRTALADESRLVDDPSTPRLYDILTSAGEADGLAHVAMARWCMTGGDLPRAARLAEALVTLYPGDPAMWRLKAEVSRAAGDAATADECMAEAAARGSTPVPFAVPGVARG
jgi:tetratricopeptide (TPR) repeat protein